EERNIVITSWEWSKPDKYLHDLISSDRRNPTVNANGPLYGSPEYSTDNMPILDPKTNKVSFFKMPVRDPEMPVSLGPGHAGAVKPTADSPYWGSEVLWDTRANNHNSMFDKQGRIWLAATVRGMDNPDWCKKGSDNPYAKVIPLDKSPRQVAMLDPKTMKYEFIDTCFGTHHPQFGYDADNTLWLSGTGPVAGWVNTKVWDETHDAQKAIGWTPFILDTNGNGKRDDYTEPGQPADAGKDTRITGGSGPYAVMPHPKDGSIWYTVGVFGGQAGFMRFDPKTQLSEFFAVPKPGVGIRGGDIDANGVAWGSESSGHLVSFDRSLCKSPLNGPNATGNHCPEGWKFYKYPGPGFEGFEDRSVEASYYTWVDQHNTVGLGENIPISTANLNDGFVAFKNGKMVMLRIPYPMGFYAKGLDGRIDDPNAGWKGRGLWSTNGDRTPWLMETGKGSSPRAVHIQVRPDPLAH
ncbi:MAG: carboxypeptidase regulatory-like domain-containing protein, partial [Pseudolabrys sp.]